ncbi:MAG: type IX secretion system membrane protein PorP/SprF [Bacteroidia bacterium]|nr:type IX secretion system membrane protein PorP/SprF [Bacteroidia bacterium]
MKKIYLTILGIFAFVLTVQSVQAQQFPFSNFYQYNPWLYNPAVIFQPGQTQIFAIHQQRRVAFSGLSHTQILNFSSAPQGMQNKMGWGIFVSNDFEHTEWRLNLLGRIGWNIINDTTFKDSTTIKNIYKLSVGGMAGLINIGSNYNGIPVYDRQDDIISDASSFTELDAGAGLQYYMETPNIKFQAGASIFQLPGNVLTKQKRALSIIPHYVIASQFLYKTPIVWMGPSVMYKEVLNDSLSIKAALLDLNWVFKFPGKAGLFAGGGYRWNNVAVNGLVGMTIWSKKKENLYWIKDWGVDLSLGFEVPLNNSKLFGPSFELGLGYRFGKVDLNTLNTLVLEYRGPFWVDASNVNDHRNKQLTGPVPGLTSVTDTTGNYVRLDYEFDDFIAQYHGEGWEGVKPFVKMFVEKVILEALYPQQLDSIQLEALRRVGKDPESWGTIKSLETIELACSLKVSKERVEFGDASILYMGEWDTINGHAINESARGKLIEPKRIANDQVVYNDADTVLTIVPDNYMSNLELAYVKLVSLRDMMLREIEEAGLPITDRDFIKMRITPDNPHQKAFQRNRITVIFRKGKKAKKVIGVKRK